MSNLPPLIDSVELSALDFKKYQIFAVPVSQVKEYPVFRLEISSASHPFYTGNEKILDSAGRVERFKSKVAKAKKSAK